MTRKQNSRNQFRSRPNLSSGRMLRCNPQLKGNVRKVRIQTPRKPNSARRQVVKAGLTNRLFSVSYIPGGSHSLKQHSNVLISGRGARDLPGVYSRCIRGKLDLKGVTSKTRRRSIYGVSRKMIGLTL